MLHRKTAHRTDRVGWVSAVGSPPSAGSRTVPTAQECHPGKSVMTKIQQYERTIALSRQVLYNVRIIIDNFCIALFSGVPKLTALYMLQHFLSFKNIIMTTNNV